MGATAMTLRMEIINGNEVTKNVYEPLWDAWWDHTAKLFG
jgi:hypothetical protein